MIYINFYEGYPEIPLMNGKGIWGTIYFDEKFIPITQDVIHGIRDWYLISNYGKVYHKYAGRLFTDEEMHNFCKYFQNNSPKPENMTVNDFCREALIYYGFEPSNRYIEILRKLYTRKQYRNIVSKYNF